MKYRRAPHTAWRKIGQETIVVDLEAKQMFGLNETGGYVWHVVDAAVDLAEVSRWLAPSGAPAPVDAGQLAAFCQRLAELGLLATEDPSGEFSEAPPGVELPAVVTAPRIVWQERIQQGPGSCAFLPGQSPLCNQTPFQ